MLSVMEKRDHRLIPLLQIAVFRAKYYDQEEGLRLMHLLLCEGGARPNDCFSIPRGVGLTYSVTHWSALGLAVKDAVPSDEPIIRLLCKAGAESRFTHGLSFARWARRRMLCINACFGLLLALQRCTRLPRDLRKQLVRTHLWETRFDPEWDVGREPLKEPAEDDPPRLIEAMYAVYF
jgi:hypothetical protein